MERTIHKIGRNSGCSCGRRKKYKLPATHRQPKLRYAVALISLLLMPALSGCRATQRVTYDMDWEYAPPDKPAPPQLPGAKHIVLRYADFPHFYEGIYSADLGPYLESLPSHRVRVEIQVTREFGCLRGYHLVRVGDRDFKDGTGHSGSTALAGEPSPWDKFKC
jgi:hypothetical protein